MREMALPVSAFGPSGRSKIMHSETGAVLVTRDGQQMLEQRLSAASALERQTLQACVGVSRRFGDGSLGAAIVLDSLLGGLLGRGRGRGSARGREAAREERVRSLLALNTLTSVMRHSESEITAELVRLGCWKRLGETKWLRGMWMSALVPALNPTSAKALELVFWRWIGARTRRPPRSAQLPDLLARCKYALDNFQLLVLPTIREGCSLSETFCADEDELFLSGHCRDHSALGDGSCFLCIKQLVHRVVADHTITAQIIVETTSLSSLVAKASGRILQMRALVQLLASQGVQAIFCCDRVDEAELFELASRGIVVTDAVPEDHLQRLALQSRCCVWPSAADVLTGLSSVPSGEGGGGGVGRLKRLEQVKLRSADTSLRISGLGSGGGGGVQHGMAHHAQAVPQLLVHCSSAAACSIHMQLLRRCLLITISALEPEGEGETGCVVPGAGANEMLWSGLWTLVGDALLAQSQGQTTISGPSAALLLRPIAQLIAGRVIARLGDLLGATGPVVTATTLRAEALCRTLADAYLQPPLLLLRNHAGEREGADASLQRALLLWKSKVLGGSSSSSSNSSLHQGWVTFIGDHAGNLSALDDCFAYGIVGSARQFWYTMTVCLEAATVSLRIGDGDVINVTKRQKI